MQTFKMFLLGQCPPAERGWFVGRCLLALGAMMAEIADYCYHVRPVELVPELLQGVVRSQVAS